MKKALSILLCLVLLLCFSSSALAVEPQYANTKAFLAYMDSRNIFYTVLGIDDENSYELVSIDNQGDKASYTFVMFFDEDYTEVAIRVWDLIEFDKAKTADVTRVINDLNNNYKYGRWIADESDNTVTIAYDVLIRDNSDSPDIILEALLHLVECINYGYELLEPYNISDSSAT